MDSKKPNTGKKADKAVRVYHFTSAAYALSNIAMRRIKVSRFSDLNDSFELLGSYSHTRRHRDEFLNPIKIGIDHLEGVICFCADWKDPVLWAHYADNLKGVALGFDIPSSRLKPVHYLTKSMKEQSKGSVKRSESIPELINKLKISKFESWAYENERRLIVTLADAEQDGGMYFLPFSETLMLKQIFVGVNCPVPKGVFKQLVSRYKHRVYVEQTRFSVRRFGVTVEKLDSRTANKPRPKKRKT